MRRVKVYFAELIDATVNFLCVLSGHFYGCWVSRLTLNRGPYSWALEVLAEDRYPQATRECDRCPYCSTKYRQRVPNPYYSSERELAGWARWWGSDVTPDDWAQWQREHPPATNGGSFEYAGQTYQFTYCANCGTSVTTSGRTA